MFKKELLDKIDNNHSSNNNNILRNECDYNYYILKFVGEEQEKKNQKLAMTTGFCINTQTQFLCIIYSKVTWNSADFVTILAFFSNFAISEEIPKFAAWSNFQHYLFSYFVWKNTQNKHQLFVYNFSIMLFLPVKLLSAVAWLSKKRAASFCIILFYFLAIFPIFSFPLFIIII